MSLPDCRNVETGVSKKSLVHAFVTTWKDVFFSFFTVHLMAQMYHIYDTKIEIWNGIQLVLSSILIVGDPMLHTLVPQSSLMHYITSYISGSGSKGQGPGPISFIYSDNNNSKLSPVSMLMRNLEYLLYTSVLLIATYRAVLSKCIACCCCPVDTCCMTRIWLKILA